MLSASKKTYQRKRYASMTPERRAVVLAQGKAWRAANAERRAAYKATYQAQMTAERRALLAARARTWRTALTEERRAELRAKSAARTKAWGLANPQRARANGNAWRAAHREHVRSIGRQQYLAREYGLTETGFAALFAAQNGQCGICSSALVIGRDTHVDHDHNTGSVRGLLCSKCNKGLGMLADSQERLAAAIDYLRRAVRGIEIRETRKRIK